MKLKELRKENKKTQQEISNTLNIPIATYVRYENEETAPSIETLCKLADFYNVSLDYIANRNLANEFIYLSEDEKTLITAYRQMNKDNKFRYLAEAQGILLAQD